MALFKDLLPLPSASAPSTDQGSNSILLLPVLLILVCQAAAAPDWRTCLELGDDRQRLACYDNHARRLVETGTAAPEREAPAAFGLQPTTPAWQLDAIESRIVHIKNLAHGRRQITLKNGQVWKQLESRSRPRLEPGVQVRIRRAALGSFLLSRPDTGGALRVKRIR
jgi:hypothetical protein